MNYTKQAYALTACWNAPLLSQPQNRFSVPLSPNFISFFRAKRPQISIIFHRNAFKNTTRKFHV